MFRISQIIYLLSIASLPAIVILDCCYSNEIIFEIDQGHCRKFGGANSNKRLITQGFECNIAICGNGKRVTEGFYCGIGSCNIFGCNCDGGCIRGNHKNEFKKIYGDQVKIIK